MEPKVLLEKAKPAAEALKPFGIALSYCLVSIAWLVILPFGIAAKYLEEVSKKFDIKSK